MYETAQVLLSYVVAFKSYKQKGGKVLIQLFKIFYT